MVEAKSVQQISNRQGDDKKGNKGSGKTEEKGVTEKKGIQFGPCVIQFFKNTLGFKPGIHLGLETSHFIRREQNKHTQHHPKNTGNSRNPGKRVKYNFKDQEIFTRNNKYIGKVGYIQVKNKKYKGKHRTGDHAQAKNHMMAVNERFGFNILIEDVYFGFDADIPVKKAAKGFC